MTTRGSQSGKYATSEFIYKNKILSVAINGATGNFDILVYNKEGKQETIKDFGEDTTLYNLEEVLEKAKKLVDFEECKHLKDKALFEYAKSQGIKMIKPIKEPTKEEIIKKYKKELLLQKQSAYKNVITKIRNMSIGDFIDHYKYKLEIIENKLESEFIEEKPTNALTKYMGGATLIHCKSPEEAKEIYRLCLELGYNWWGFKDSKDLSNSHWQSDTTDLYYSLENKDYLTSTANYHFKRNGTVKAEDILKEQKEIERLAKFKKLGDIYNKNCDNAMLTEHLGASHPVFKKDRKVKPYRRYRQDFKESEMTLIDNGNGCKIPICPDCMAEGRKYEFGEPREGFYHCKNLYKLESGEMSQCCQVFKEGDDEK